MAFHEALTTLSFDTSATPNSSGFITSFKKICAPEILSKLISRNGLLPKKLSPNTKIIFDLFDVKSDA